MPSYLSFVWRMHRLRRQRLTWRGTVRGRSFRFPPAWSSILWFKRRSPEPKALWCLWRRALGFCTSKAEACNAPGTSPAFSRCCPTIPTSMAALPGNRSRSGTSSSRSIQSRKRLPAPLSAVRFQNLWGGVSAPDRPFPWQAMSNLSIRRSMTSAGPMRMLRPACGLTCKTGGFSTFAEVRFMKKLI